MNTTPRETNLLFVREDGPCGGASINPSGGWTRPFMTTFSGGQQLMPPPVSWTYRFLRNHLSLLDLMYMTQARHIFRPVAESLKGSYTPTFFRSGTVTRKLDPVILTLLDLLPHSVAKKSPEREGKRNVEYGDFPPFHFLLLHARVCLSARQRKWKPIHFIFVRIWKTKKILYEGWKREESLVAEGGALISFCSLT